MTYSMKLSNTHILDSCLRLFYNVSSHVNVGQLGTSHFHLWYLGTGHSISFHAPHISYWQLNYPIHNQQSTAPAQLIDLPQCSPVSTLDISCETIERKHARSCVNQWMGMDFTPKSDSASRYRNEIIAPFPVRLPPFDRSAHCPPSVQKSTEFNQFYPLQRSDLHLSSHFWGIRRSTWTKKWHPSNR